jgi:hypothetical protein
VKEGRERKLEGGLIEGLKEGRKEGRKIEERHPYLPCSARKWGS